MAVRPKPTQLVVDGVLTRSTPQGRELLRTAEIVKLARDGRNDKGRAARHELGRRYVRRSFLLCESGSGYANADTWDQWAALARLALDAQREAHAQLAVSIHNHCGVTVTFPRVHYTFWPPHTQLHEFDFGDAVPPEHQPLAWRLAYAVRIDG